MRRPQVGKMRSMGRDEMLQAEAEARRLHDVISKLEADRDAASARVDEIASEPFETPEEEAEISRRVEAADQDVQRIQEEIAEAEDDFRRAQEDFDHYSPGADDDDGDPDEETGERLSVWDAAQIWLSSGKDEDYMVGYTEDELQRAASEEERRAV